MVTSLFPVSWNVVPPRSMIGCGWRSQLIVKRKPEEVMKTHYTVALSLLVGVAAGATAIAALHAQSKPPAYVVAEIDLTNAAAFDKEYVPPAGKAVADGGGKYLVRGGETISFYGEPPKSRIIIMTFESLDKAKAAFESPAYKAAKAIGDKYAKFRIYAVEGLAQ